MSLSLKSSLSFDLMKDTYLSFFLILFFCQSFRQLETVGQIKYLWLAKTNIDPACNLRCLTPAPKSGSRGSGRGRAVSGWRAWPAGPIWGIIKMIAARGFSTYRGKSRAYRDRTQGKVFPIRRSSDPSMQHLRMIFILLLGALPRSLNPLVPDSVFAV